MTSAQDILDTYDLRRALGQSEDEAAECVAADLGVDSEFVRDVVLRRDMCAGAG